MFKKNPPKGMFLNHDDVLTTKKENAAEKDFDTTEIIEVSRVSQHVGITNVLINFFCVHRLIPTMKFDTKDLEMMGKIKADFSIKTIFKSLKRKPNDHLDRIDSDDVGIIEDDAVPQKKMSRLRKLFLCRYINSSKFFVQ